MPVFNNPMEALRHHVSGAIERGEGQVITCQPADHALFLSVKIPFSGFYETMHDKRFDSWLEMEIQNANEDGEVSEELTNAFSNAYYTDINWKAVHTGYAKAYVDYLAEEASNAGSIPLAMHFEEMVSPREYNFETDRLFAKIDLATIKAIFKALPRQSLAKAVEDSCTSYSGFISHYSADLDEWESNIAEWDHNEIGIMLACYLEFIGLDDEKLQWSIMDDYDSNGDLENLMYDNAGETFKAAANALFNRKDENP